MPMTPASEPEPFLAEDFDDVCCADGLESAFVGLVVRFGCEPIACYDYELVLRIYMDRDGMTREEAEEFFDFNTVGAWVGPRTPCYLRRGTLP